MRQGKVASHRSDVDITKLELPRGLELAEPLVSSVVVVASRNFAELPFPPAMNAEQQAEVMRVYVCWATPGLTSSSWGGHAPREQRIKICHL